MLSRTDTCIPAATGLWKARPHRWAFLCLTIALLTLSSAATAAEREDFRVNDDAGTADQTVPRIAVTADGSFVIVWADKRRANGDIYLQRFDPDGQPVGDNVRVNDDIPDSVQAQPSVAADLTGRYVAVWQDYRNFRYPQYPDIYLQRFDSAAVPIDPNENLTGATDTYRDTPDISMASWGTGVIVWSEYVNGTWDVLGQLIGSDGALLGSSFRINDAPAGQQHAPRVSTAAAGWFVVTWYDNRLGNDDIFAQRFDSAGTPLGPNVKINTDATTKKQIFPDVATDGRGHFTVVWIDYRNGIYPANPDIYAARLDTNMLPVTTNRRLNTDGTTRAQRYPAIASDRAGNVAVIWGDSTGSSWDIIGQMIDYDGVVREVNFEANTFTVDAQLQPDVALDGEYRYITWADRRNGNYDIYASITRYNDPSLFVEPAVLEFNMSGAGVLPDPQYITVDHAGYYPVEFDVVCYNAWLGFTPTTGTSPDSIEISVTDNTLPDGVYHGDVAVIDRSHGDSTYVVPVRLTVSSSILNVAVDTLYFSIPTGYDTTVTQLIGITNDGLGDLHWTATESSPWLNLSADSGVAPSNLGATVDPTGLPTGNYLTAIIIDAGMADNSPDTVWVRLQMADTIPIMQVTPLNISVSVPDPADLDTAFTIANLGGGTLTWTVTGGAPWLQVSPGNGSGNATVRLTAGGELTDGINATTLTVTGAGAFASPQEVIVTVEYSPLLLDTLAVQPTNLMPGELGVTVVMAKLNNSITHLMLPLKFDTNYVTIDSLHFAPGLPLYMNKYYRIYPADGAINITLDRTPPDTGMLPGGYLLAELFLTAGDTAAVTRIDTLNNDSLYPHVITRDAIEKTPFVIAGNITIGNPTSVDPGPDDRLPAGYRLFQNYPNPFNAGTVIEFELPEPAEIQLDVFDILGRKVAQLADGRHAAGRHRIAWDGRTERGEEAPSGVYLYRLTAGNGSTGAKMLLLK